MKPEWSDKMERGGSEQKQKERMKYSNVSNILIGIILMYDFIYIYIY